MARTKKAVAVARAAINAQITDSLENARARIEARFLDGGAVLLSVLDSVSKMIETLDGMTASLTDETAERTKADLGRTMQRLSGLPQVEEKRQASLGQISEIEKELVKEVASMRETLRYLRTFAITAKITGAGIPEFSGFAEEIIERIQYGSGQVENFASKLSELAAQMKPAGARGQQILATYRDLVPAIAADLERGTTGLAGHHVQLASAARQVRKLAGNVQAKLATILSAMQIGDITRQRVEHCQSSLSLIEDYLASDDGRALKAEQRARLQGCVLMLVHRQLEQTSGDFRRDTAKIVSTVESFGGDVKEIVALGQAMQDDEGAGSSLIRQLETNIASAQQVVSTVTATASESDQLSLNTGRIVRELLDGIEIVRVVRTDIQYMALNTNLRCSRIGEEGRAINVVTGELRAFAGRMDEIAERIIVALQQLGTCADALSGNESDESAEAGLHDRLAVVLDDIRRSADHMDGTLARVDEQGRAAADQMQASVRKLDFRAELGDILEDCTRQIAEECPAGLPDISGIENAMAEIGARIGRLYTMNTERELHGEIFGAAPVPVVGEAAAGQSSGPLTDEDLFEDALF